MVSGFAKSLTRSWLISGRILGFSLGFMPRLPFGDVK
jgi:hypothetical protein